MTNSVAKNSAKIKQELITIRDYLRWAVSQFNQANLYYGHGTDNAWDEAVYLILRTLHLPNNSDPSVLDARLTLSEREAILDILNKRIKKRIPAPYLTHEAYFAGLSFYVDERVLIPRSPMAELIEQRFQPWIEPDNIQNILDLCTGSGCIAIACAEYVPDVTVTASDISVDALKVAKINIDKYKLSNQIKLIKSDLFKNIPKQKFDVIICNPPYVDANDMKTLPAEYQHEPKQALAAGKDGLSIIAKILENASSYLSLHGILIIEVGNSEQALIDQFPDIPFTWLEFERSDVSGGVFLLTKEQVDQLKR